ncbi:MAG: 50S ribosomal protein L32e [Nanoarchaeota archaeon]|nr:50S ribosomal protein L32e [Nanoarchaeota archaeon]
MASEKLLKARAAVKSKKPTFKRGQTNQFAKFKNDPKWRKPKGMGNKVRRQRRGQAAMPKVGYGSPKMIKGLNKEGLKEILVYNAIELANIKTGEIAKIAGNVGGKKKLEILNKAKELKMGFANVKDIEKTIQSLTKVKKEDKKDSKKDSKKDTKKETKKDSKKETPKEAKKEVTKK